MRILHATLALFCLLGCAVSAAERPLVDFGRWDSAGLERIIAEARRLETPGERIVSPSRNFLATPYVADTLIGDPQTAEQLVITLAGFDCFTFLDVIEALRRAADLDDFPEQLKQVRYRGGKVSYENRRHFFSDWVADDTARVGDMTAAVGQGRARAVVKQLNLKSDGSRWLPGLPVTRREIVYIPADEMDRDVLSALQAGDYVGIYSDHAGLDVSHVGLLVQGKDRFMLRHASLSNGVVDVDLLEYLQGKPGLVVYRAR
ncbi:N-acetylmuramoyl-L-alanine amidase-like domain-containing protein [Trichloromonas sp.]|uniref:N-acetylmuramoyl-L-alanine amidase-like domain-containing protein n=1 Tax=Trichloromonas sp. TaxID=3069249 RepID=UPI003D81A648